MIQIRRYILFTILFHILGLGVRQEAFSSTYRRRNNTKIVQRKLTTPKLSSRLRKNKPKAKNNKTHSIVHKQARKHKVIKEKFITDKYSYFETIQQDTLYRQDSIRLRNGGTSPIPSFGDSITTINLTTPQTLRFYYGDLTLSSHIIKSLYFTRQSKILNEFSKHAISKIDVAIAAEKYHEALRITDDGLFSNPTDIGLLKKACELAHHLNAPKLNTYIWQISELFSQIQHTGDGKTPQTAWRVMLMDDALLYEHFWIGTEYNQILNSRTQLSSERKNILMLRVQNKNGKIDEHYYCIDYPNF